MDFISLYWVMVTLVTKGNGSLARSGRGLK